MVHQSAIAIVRIMAALTSRTGTQLRSSHSLSKGHIGVLGRNYYAMGRRWEPPIKRLSEIDGKTIWKPKVPLELP
jgi:hypothetical protein